MALVRLQKLLSERGISSRRQAEDLIRAGKVKINGHIASLGDKADIRKDTVTVRGKALDKECAHVYLMLYKPRGYVTTLRDERGRKCVADLVKDVGRRVYPVGRLDRDSEGLLLMTDDGDFANAVSHPAREVPKTYRVTLRGEVGQDQLSIFRTGMSIDGRLTAPAQAEILLSEPDRTVVQVILTEGRNREIRRLCAVAGLEVIRLKRTAVGEARISGLKPGAWRFLTSNEVRGLLIAAGSRQKIAAEYIRRGAASQDPRRAKR